MNARDGLERIRSRLLEQGARDETLALVDQMIRRASTPETERVQVSQTQLIRMLVKTPAAAQNYAIYNDLVKLEEQMTEGAARRAAEAEAEANKPMPKSKKYYKQLKERERHGA